ncbi:MAG: polysaccharide biosynthesis protein [Holosporaceae bacterium]|nr:polysaccharide biosynthesis protein [Holosporaceae bacterium]
MNIKKILDFLLKKNMINALCKNFLKTVCNYAEKKLPLIKEMLDKVKVNVPEECAYHLRNISVVFLSYTTVSLLIYPEFKMNVFCKEIFALLCAYGAIFFWFLDRIAKEIPFRVAIGVTACIAPMLFVNNSFGAAIICLLLIVFCEFLIFEYIRGCNLFSNLIPVYIICENEEDIVNINNLSTTYKVLELIALFESGNNNDKLSPLKSTNDIKNWLHKISYFPFYPSPKKLIYLAGKNKTKNFDELLRISTEYSIPLIKASENTSCKQSPLFPLNISPVSFADLDEITISSQDRSALTSAFKAKRVCICYDGRRSVLDLIYAISLVNSVDLTICCESEDLAIEAEQTLLSKCVNKNYKVKIINLDLLCLQDAKLDILFYCMPVKSFYSGEDSLKESVIKNVLDTNRLIKFAQSCKISFVFILSNIRALNANNWVGATLRFGELFAQFADSQSRKLHTKFRVVRMPDCATDKIGVFGKIVSSILSFGYVNIDFPNVELANVYYRRNILPPLLKFITSTMKAYDFTSSVYTIVPEHKISLNELIEKICNVFCLKKDKDIRVIYNTKSEMMELEDFPNISESLEKTTIDNVFCTKFVNVKPSAYESVWSVEEINKMSTRELISLVFQSLSEKIKK